MDPFDFAPPITLPAWWKNKYPSLKLQTKMRNPGLWMDRPAPNTALGKRVLQANAPLFELAKRLEDVDYTLEDIAPPFFELVPGFLYRQGIGFSAGNEDAVHLDLYFFPMDYSEKRDFPLQFIRLPVLETNDLEALAQFAKERFPTPAGKRKTAALPFSLEAVAEVEGYFLDHMVTTARKCRAAVKNSLEQQMCEAFLSNMKDVLKRA